MEKQINLIRCTQYKRFNDLRDLLFNKTDKLESKDLSELISFKDFFETYNARLIFITDETDENCINLDRIYNNKYSFTLFENKNLILLDKTLNPKQDICLCNIFLDTNLTSKIDYKDEESKQIIQSFRENKGNLVHSHYIIENIINFDKQEFLDKTESKLQKWYEIGSTNISIQDTMKFLDETYDNRRQKYIQARNLIYAAILKMVILKKQYKSLEERFDEYYQFGCKELRNLGYLSFVFAHLFLNNNPLRFFGKLNVGDSEKLLKNISNTALDLMFLDINSSLYCQYIRNIKHQDDFFIPFFATNDNGLKEFSNFVKWKGLLEVEGIFIPIQADKDTSKRNLEIVEEYYADNSNTEVDRESLMRQLEEEIRRIFKNPIKDSK